MSIAINSNPERDQIVASAAQVLFTYSFPVFAATYLKVYKRGGAVPPDDSTQLLAYPGGYTVQGVGEAAGGTITLTVPASAGDIITIVGAEPIERASIFQDLNPFTVSLNQQLNEQTVMAQQTYTYWNHITPHYNFDELISPEVRPFKRILPMLPTGHTWVGRGEIGDTPDDITTQYVGAVGTGNMTSSGPGMRASIARWTGTDFVVTDSEVNINANLFEPTAGTVYDTTGFSNTWGAVHLPAHVTASRPAAPQNGDVYYDTTLQKFYGYVNGAWSEFSTTGGSSASVTITQVAHGLVLGDWVRFDGTDYVRARADTAQNAEGIWLVSSVIDANNFVATQSGFIEGLGAAGYAPFTAGSVYFLSETVAGDIGLTEPTDAATVSKPCFIATDVDKGWIFPWRGVLNTGFVGQNGGGGGTDTSTLAVNQVAHGFIVGDVVYCTGSLTFAKALATTLAQTIATWIVSVVTDANNFTIQQSGFNSTLAGLTAGSIYYLDETVPGLMTTTIPVLRASYNKPVFVAVTTASGFVIEERPVLIGDDGSVVTVNQVAHGFVVEDVLRILASGTYTKALADTLANSRAVGIVVEVLDANTFVLQTSGFSQVFAGKVAATQYYLSEAVAGLLTAVEPAAAGEVSKPMFAALTATSGYILEQRPMLQPSANGGSGGGGTGAILQVVYNPILPYTQYRVRPAPMPIFDTTITLSSVTSKVKITYMIAGVGSFSLCYPTLNGVILNDWDITPPLATPNVSAPININLSALTTYIFIHSPASIAPLTYGLYYLKGGGKIDINNGTWGSSCVTLEEIA